MIRLLRLVFGVLISALHSRRELFLENLVLRQQLAVVKRRRGRLKPLALDKLFWVAIRRFWSGWKRSLLIVRPETVIAWHRAGFKLYWRAISKARRVVGRRAISQEVRGLIFRMVAENPTWGAPRIHGELQMLGFDISERTVSRWVQRAPRNPDKVNQWKAFLKNHREAIAAMDFFTVHTATFKLLYCFFILSHDRRRILHFNVTRNPTSHWVVQQLREAFPFELTHKYLIFDRDAKFGSDIIATVKTLGISPTRTSYRSPWQNGIAERWVQSCRRDLLDHVIVFNELHLKRLLAEYVRYYHEDRTHLGLDKETPGSRAHVAPFGRVTSRSRLGGLHHRYDRAA